MPVWVSLHCTTLHRGGVFIWWYSIWDLGPGAPNTLPVREHVLEGMNPCLLLALPEAFRELGESADANAVTWHAKLCLDGPDHHPEASNLMVGPRIFRTQVHTTVLLRAEVEEDCRAGSPFWSLFPRHDQLSPRGLLGSVREMHSIVTAGCTAEIESYCIFMTSSTSSPSHPLVWKRHSQLALLLV